MQMLTCRGDLFVRTLRTAESIVAVAFDNPQCGIGVTIDECVAVCSAANADGLFLVDWLQSKCRWQRRKTGLCALAADRETRTAAVDYDRRKHAQGVTPNCVVVLLLGTIPDICQFADQAERICIAKREVVDPIDEAGTGVFMQFGGKSRDDRISCGERVDCARYPTSCNRLSLPIEIVCMFG